MADLAKTQELNGETMLLVLAGGDCSRLSPEQKMAYYNMRCEAAGLDPRAQPFEFVKLQGKEVLYAKAAATSQLASNNHVVCSILSQATESGIRVATVRATAKDGRQTEEIGAVPIEGLKAEALCNAMMKAITKAKRRAILSLCGLGMMDETELDTVAGAQVVAATPVVDTSPPTPPRSSPKTDESRATRITLLWQEIKDRVGTQNATAAWEAAGKRCAPGKQSKEWTDSEIQQVALFLSMWSPETPSSPLDDRVRALRAKLVARVGTDRATEAWMDVCSRCANGQPSPEWSEAQFAAVGEYLTKNWFPERVPGEDSD
jgi:hypothetical protein